VGLPARKASEKEFFSLLNSGGGHGAPNKCQSSRVTLVGNSDGSLGAGRRCSGLFVFAGKFAM
jgi:hypothetical protein